jgi:hypothetical protein
MFLASKVEETPGPLRNAIFLSYEIIHKKMPKPHREYSGKMGYMKNRKS